MTDILTPDTEPADMHASLVNDTAAEDTTADTITDTLNTVTITDTTITNENTDTTNTQQQPQSHDNSITSTPVPGKRSVQSKRATIKPDLSSSTTTIPASPATSTRRTTTAALATPHKQAATNSRRTTLQTPATGNDSSSNTARASTGTLPPSTSARDLIPADNVLTSVVSDPALLPDLHNAAASNDYVRAQALITSQPMELRIEYVNQTDSLGNIALFYALSNEHIATGTTALLLDYGSNVNTQNNKRNTPLHIAFFHGHKKFVRMLIGEFNASVTIENSYEQLCHQTAPQPKGFNNDSVTAQFQHNGAMLHFITQCTDAYTDNVNKKLIMPHTSVQRCYYRSLFDLADTNRCGYLTLSSVVKLLTQLSDDDRDSKVDTQLTAEWYRGLDRDKNGVVYFNEFLYAVLTALNEREKQRRKAKRKAQLKAAKSAKKAEEAARVAKYK